MGNVAGVDGRLFDAGEVVDEPVVRGPVGKSFRLYDPDQMFLMPPSIADWVPEDHLARFVSELVEEVLDLNPFLAVFTEARGFPPYDPRLMLKVLIYGYTTGVRSSRKIEKRCHDDVAFRFLAANQAPDFRSVARFRRRHLVALDALFLEVLKLCQAAGMVRLGRVALDGSKVRANASRRKAMSFKRLIEREADLQAEVDSLFADAEAADVADDARFGEDGRDDDLGGEMAGRESRLARIRRAKAEIARRESRLVKIRRARSDLQADAARRAGADAARKAWHTTTTTTTTPTTADTTTADSDTTDSDTDSDIADIEVEFGLYFETDTDTDTRIDFGTGAGERAKAAADAAHRAASAATVADKAQRNFTDPDSRIMKTSDGSFHYCYNAQTAADDAYQVIVATRLSNRSADCPEFASIVDEITSNCGRQPDQVLADAGYFSDDNVTAADTRGIDVLIATGRLKHHEKPSAQCDRPADNATSKQQMAYKLRTEPGRAAYARRKAIIEPVFGQIDTVQGGKQVLLRSEQAAAAEWRLIAACHNLRKLFNYTRAARPAPT